MSLPQRCFPQHWWEFTSNLVTSYSLTLIYFLYRIHDGGCLHYSLINLFVSLCIICFLPFQCQLVSCLFSPLYPQCLGPQEALNNYFLKDWSQILENGFTSGSQRSRSKKLVLGNPTAYSWIPQALHIVPFGTSLLSRTSSPQRPLGLNYFHPLAFQIIPHELNTGAQW